MYALCEENHPGLYRTNNGGENWFLVSRNHTLAERAPYYMRMAVAPDNPEKYMEWLRKRRSQGFRRSYKRIVDLEKEGLILLLDALENLGDTYGIFGFSGYGRENVEYFTIKDLDENFSPLIPKRIDRISPLH